MPLGEMEESLYPRYKTSAEASVNKCPEKNMFWDWLKHDVAFQHSQEPNHVSATHGFHRVHRDLPLGHKMTAADIQITVVWIICVSLLIQYKLYIRPKSFDKSYFCYMKRRLYVKGWSICRIEFVLFQWYCREWLLSVSVSQAQHGK